MFCKICYANVRLMHVGLFPIDAGLRQFSGGGGGGFKDHQKKTRKKFPNYQGRRERKRNTNLFSSPPNYRTQLKCNQQEQQMYFFLAANIRSRSTFATDQFLAANIRSRSIFGSQHQEPINFGQSTSGTDQFLATNITQTDQFLADNMFSQ